MKLVTKKEIAKLIMDSAIATLDQAVANGGELDVRGIAKAIGGNASLMIALEVYERGIEEP